MKMNDLAKDRKPCHMRGFSLVELMVVVVIILVMLSAAIYAIKPALQSARADAAAEYVINQIRHTRERAIDERRQYRINFNDVACPTGANNNITVYQGNLNLGVTVFGFDSCIVLPNDMPFALPGIVPAVSPDGLVGQTKTVDFSITGGGIGGTVIYCNPDGTVTDPVGGFTSGAVFMARNNDLISARAVSLFGATGRLKAWRLAQINAVATRWIQE